MAALCEQVVVKLALENGNDGIMKRMKLPPSGSLKYLQSQAIRYAFAIEDNVELNLKDYNVRLYYKDLDGDSILLASGKDLRDAFRMHLSKKSIKIVARVEQANKKTTASSTTQTTASSTTQTAKSTAPVQMSHVVEGLVSVLAALAIATSTQVVKVSENIVTELNSRNNTDRSNPSSATDSTSNTFETADIIDDKETTTLDNGNGTSSNNEDINKNDKVDQDKNDGSSNVSTEVKTESAASLGSAKATYTMSMLKNDIRKVVKSAPVKAAVSPFKAAVMSQMNAAKMNSATAIAEKPVAPASTDKDAVVMENAAAATESNSSSAAEQKPNLPKDDTPFIHGRHTCDKCLTTPIIGKRYHAVHLPDYDLCQNCYESCESSKSQNFEVAELDRDRIFQEKWRRRHARFKCQASRSTSTRPNVNPTGPNRSYHGYSRPYLRGPGPRGSYFNGTPMFSDHCPFGIFPQPSPQPENFGVCHPPMSKHLNANEQDTELFEAIRRSIQDKMTELKNASKGVDGNPKDSNVSDKDESEVASGATTEETLIKSNGNSTSLSVASSGEVSGKKSDSKSVVEPEIVVTPVAFGGDDSKSKSSQSRDVSCASDTDGSVAVVFDQTLDMIATAIDAFSGELHRESGDNSKTASNNAVTEDHLNVSNNEVAPPNVQVEVVGQIDSDDISTETSENEVDYQDFESDSESNMDGNSNDNGVTIVDGVTVGNDDDDSRSSWSVVDDELRMPNDEDIARAAQVIGSALFSSDMARSKSENGNNFDGSTISSVPTVTNSIGNGSNFSNAQFDRWALQLNQLHELGFSNDALMVDIMERLNAANLGSDLQEEVTVSQVVNALMKDM